MRTIIYVFFPHFSKKAQCGNLNILAEEAVGRRDDPARGHQGAGTEVRVSDVNCRHPGVCTWQGRGPT